MVDVKRKKTESFEALVRRFNKKIIQSGKMIQAKRVQLLEKEPNRNFRKAKKVARIKKIAAREFLRKTGKLKEDNY